MKKNKFVKFRHKFWKPILRFLTNWFFKIRFHVHYKNRVKLKKNEKALVLCNHQTDIDPIIVSYSINRPVYFVCTDSLKSNKFRWWLITHFLGAIPKSKGIKDFGSMKALLTVSKENGVIGLFPEGNRTYGEFQYHMGPELVHLVKACKAKILLFNIKGGFACSPRFAKKWRKGPIDVSLEKTIEIEEWQEMDDDEILDTIVDTLKVYDSELGYKAKTKVPAEYLEKEFFVCPKCHKAQTLVSHGSHITCQDCGFDAEYSADLKLTSSDPSFFFKNLNDWYQFQKQWVKDYQAKENEVIFMDENVRIFETSGRRKLLAKGRMVLTDKELICDDKIKIPMGDIVVSSPISGLKFNIKTENNNFLIIGKERFNPLKYVLMFHKLDTKMKLENTDIYFNLD